MYICDFEVDISIIHVYLLMRKLCFDFFKKKLDFKGEKQITPKAISNQNLFLKFQS